MALIRRSLALTAAVLLAAACGAPVDAGPGPDRNEDTAQPVPEPDLDLTAPSPNEGLTTPVPDDPPPATEPEQDPDADPEPGETPSLADIMEDPSLWCDLAFEEQNEAVLDLCHALLDE
ncbi:hypothetical protein [Streptomyces sp. NPDC127098]|uniref:hypothetical protein n=1 Tax=Streptomyces sp. NPDC127098 TaxID=3347137 RepID=UPI00366A0B11